MSTTGDALSDDIRLLVEQRVDFYRKVPGDTVIEIKKEVGMTLTATTITEYYKNIGIVEGEERGEERGEKRGEKRGIIKGKIENMENLYMMGILTKEQYNSMIAPLKTEMQRVAV